MPKKQGEDEMLRPWRGLRGWSDDGAAKVADGMAQGRRTLVADRQTPGTKRLTLHGFDLARSAPIQNVVNPFSKSAGYLSEEVAYPLLSSMGRVGGRLVGVSSARMQSSRHRGRIYGLPRQTPPDPEKPKMDVR
jgi:hypothetical protein